MADLLQTTVEMARRSQESVTSICAAIGVSTRWYHKLMAGQMADPSVRRIQRLHDHLVSRAAQSEVEDDAA